jgi:hypothetical protein
MRMEPAPANLDMINKITLGNGNGCGDWKERLRADVFSHGQTTRLVLTGSFPQSCGEQRWNIAVQEHPQFVLGVSVQLWAELGGSWPAACATAWFRPRRAGRRVAIADSWRSGARHQQVLQQCHGAPVVPDPGHGEPDAARPRRRTPMRRSVPGSMRAAWRSRNWCWKTAPACRGANGYPPKAWDACCRQPGKAR